MLNDEAQSPRSDDSQARLEQIYVVIRFCRRGQFCQVHRSLYGVDFALTKLGDEVGHLRGRAFEFGRDDRR